MFGSIILKLEVTKYIYIVTKIYYNHKYNKYKTFEHLQYHNGIWSIRFLEFGSIRFSNFQIFGYGFFYV